jgi:Ca-activated chloride channel homolog
MKALEAWKGLLALPKLFLGITFLTGSAWAQFSTDAQMVVLHVTVRDQKGGFVSGLTKNDFKVLENGAPQEVTLFAKEDVPVSVGLAVDNSGSMRPKRADVGLAALAFVHNSNPKDELFVINFNDTVTLGLPDTKLFSASPEELTTALSSAFTGGRTALYDGLMVGIDTLSKGTGGKKVLILISDGGDNASRHTLPEVLKEAEKSDVIIYCVGLFDEYDPDKNPKLLRRLARETGGEAFLPQEFADVVPICGKIAQDIRNQYTSGYVPKNGALDGTYRKITVTASSPHHNKLLVRTRAGYIAAPHEPASSESKTHEAKMSDRK